MTDKGKKHSFGDIDFHQKKEKLREEIWQVINGLQALHQNGHYKTSLQKCRGAITPIEGLDDAGRLPIGLKAQYPRKADCVVAVVCRTIVEYWDFYKTGHDDPATMVESYLVTLTEYIEFGLDAYKVKGTMGAGHFLEKK